MQRGEISNEDSLKALFELQHKEANPNDPPPEYKEQKQKTVPVEATGDTYHYDPQNPAMLPVPQSVIHAKFQVVRTYTDEKTGQERTIVTRSLNEKEYKLFFLIIHDAWNELEPEALCEIQTVKIKNYFEQQGIVGDTGTNWIWEAANALHGTRVKWTETNGDKRCRKSLALVPYIELEEENRKEGILRFRLQREIVPILKEPLRFAKLRLHFLMSLSSKYAVALYCILEGYANYDYKNVFTFELALIRSWLKVEPEQYRLYNDFRRFVLEPAFKQINKNPQGAGFSVSYKPIKRGRKVHAIEITINKTKERVHLENKIKAKKKRQAVEPLVLPTVKLDPEKLKRKAKQKGLISRYDLYALQAAHEQAWRQWLWKTGKCDGMKDPEGSFIGFLLHKKEKGAL